MDLDRWWNSQPVKDVTLRLAFVQHLGRDWAPAKARTAEWWRNWVDVTKAYFYRKNGTAVQPEACVLDDATGLWRSKALPDGLFGIFH